MDVAAQAVLDHGATVVSAIREVHMLQAVINAAAAELIAEADEVYFIEPTAPQPTVEKLPHGAPLWRSLPTA